jgi:hypothetical protein
MQEIRRVVFALVVTIVAAISVSASGPAGMYAVLEKVVFEPNEQAVERIQLWGAFAFVDGGIQQGRTTAPPQKGYLYFTIPPTASQAQKETIRKEWADFKAVAGTGQAVAFGNWFYLGPFTNANQGNVMANNSAVHIRTGSPSSSALIPYSTNTGVGKLAATGSHAKAVEELRALLKK